MKGIFVTIGGLGDLPNDKFEEKTLLEVSHIPNLDLFATRGELGFVYPTLPGESSTSTESIFSFLGNERDAGSRSFIEAVGAGIDVKDGDLVFSVNFGTINSSGKVIDRRAGRVVNDSDAKSFCREINSINFPYSFEIFPIKHQKAILIFRGNSVENITGNDSTYTKRSGENIEFFERCLPRVRSQLARDTADMVNEFLSIVNNYLHKSPTNYSRIKKGLLPVNYLFLKNPGTLSPNLKKYKNWVSACYSPFEIGFSKLSKMKTVSFVLPKFRKMDVYSNVWESLERGVKNSIRVLKKKMNDYDYFYVHFDELVFASQDNKPHEKKAMLEYLDEFFFRELVKIATRNKLKVLVCGTQNLPCKMKKINSDPIPLLFYNGGIPKKRVLFNEIEAKKGKLGRILGRDMLNLFGFLK